MYMKYKEIKCIIKEYKEFQKCIYICNFITCDYEKMKYCTVSIVRNGFGKYVVTKWTDYEYQRYSERKIFSDKDLAADNAWKLFVGDEKYKKFLDDKK